MKILVAADMEGVTGVVHWEHVSPSHGEYDRFRRLMTEDVNAAIRGAFAGGATAVSVTDGHHDGRNILIEELDERAALNAGTPALLSMVEGVDQDVDGVIFIGYHARAGSRNAILDHTWSEDKLANLWINDRFFGEAGLNAAVCGHFDVPVIMISGDQTACAEARDLLGDIETAIVKIARGQTAAECLPPSVTIPMIEEAARRAVERLLEKQSPAPFKVRTPIRMVVEFAQSVMADSAAIMPGAERLEDRKVAYMADDMVIIYRAFQALLELAG